tara:strand:- start:13364 stop:14995 length:1632 start_codon:yes stop_codon:yes gene_type:complete
LKESEFNFNGSLLNQRTIFGHPTGLFVLFFTEMWERFSYYGMRAILVLFLTSSLLSEGWGWEREDALVLYGWYTGLAYFTPLIGGIVADKFLGYRNATVIGAFIMAVGHGFMALEYLENIFFFLGIGSIIIGNGLFKPNISSMVGQLYKDSDVRKDGAYTIFYMGINCGAFLGILLCGYLGETIGWHWGFGVAGIFMFFGMLQFYFTQNIFGSIGLKPEKKEKKADETKNDYPIKSIEMDRIFVIFVFSAATIFFWWAFEQAGGSMTIFANDYTNRSLTGEASLIFKILNTLITIVPMMVITYVLIKLFQNIFHNYFLSNIFLCTSFIIIWAIILFMLGLIPNFISEFLSYYLDFFKHYVPFNWNASEIVDTEIPASWFSVLNSLFIIIFAPIFSMFWASRFNPSGPVKFSIGLILLGLGFGFLAYGSISIPYGAQTASVSIFWLVFAYLFHTLGELCVSPVGLSYVSKLAPLKLVGLMMGFWLLANFFANLIGGFTGSYIDKISSNIGLSGFFLIFTLVPILVGLIIFLFRNNLIRKMHGYY